MIMHGKRLLLQIAPDRYIVGLIDVSAGVGPSARFGVVRLLWYLVPLLQPSVPSRGLLVQNNLLRFHVFAVYLLSDLDGPPTAFPLSRPQCTVGVLARTHWGASDAQAGWQLGQRANPYLLHC